MSGWSPLSYTVEGLSKWLHRIDQRLTNIERRGSWNYDTEFPLTDAEIIARGGIGQTLSMAASGDSIASGGDYLTFDAVIHQHAFGAAASVGQSITWPASAVGEVQVELAWDSFQGGGTVEVEVDGIVPPWGLLADGVLGQVGWKRRSGHLTEGSVVKIKVTQASGSAQTLDAFVQFSIPDPTAGPGIFEESLWFDSRNVSATSAMTLASGGQYRIRVEGNLDGNTSATAGAGKDTVIYPSPGFSATNEASFDADTKYALIGGADSGTVPVHLDWFRIDTGSGFVHIEPVGGPFATPQAGHIYDFVVTGQGSPVSFTFADPVKGDNSGQFKIDINRMAS